MNSRNQGKQLQLSKELFHSVMSGKRVMYCTTDKVIRGTILKYFKEACVDLDIKKIDGGFTIELKN